MKLVAIAVVFAAVSFGQSKPAGLRYFTDGAGVELRTESSGGTSPLSTAGSVIGGTPARRVVLDKNDKPLFAYDIGLKKLPDGRVAIRIGPVDQQKAKTPTLAAARDFPPLNVGDEVQVDIMYRPATGEKLFDVLKIVEDRESYPRSPTAERFSFERITVKVDGKAVAERSNSWMLGKALKIHTAMYGDYYLLLTPTPDLPFQASGWVDHTVLRFRSGAQQVEVIGKSNILQHSDYGTVWVYHVAEGLEKLNAEMAQLLRVYTPNHPKVRELQARIAAAAEAGIVDFHCADNMDQLLPKEQRGKEE